MAMRTAPELGTCPRLKRTKPIIEISKAVSPANMQQSMQCIFFMYLSMKPPIYPNLLKSNSLVPYNILKIPKIYFSLFNNFNQSGITINNHSISCLNYFYRIDIDKIRHSRNFKG